MSAAMKASSGAVSAVEIQSRRVISESSGFSSFTDAVRGSRAMPHIGQVPGPICRTSGCIGHVYSPAAGTSAAALPLPEGARNARGSSRKRRAQPSAQK